MNITDSYNSKNCDFFPELGPQIAQFCANVSKRPKYIKAIYFDPSERPHHALLENSIFL